MQAPSVGPYNILPVYLVLFILHKFTVNHQLKQTIELLVSVEKLLKVIIDK